MACGNAQTVLLRSVICARRRLPLLLAVVFGLAQQQAAHAQPASVMDFGAKGDGATDDTASIQRALDAHRTVYFPEPPKWYRVSSLQLHSGHTLIGPGKWDREVSGETGRHAVVKGDGSGPLLKTGDLQAQPQVSVRGITLRDLSLHNTDHPAVELEYATDFLIESCWIAVQNRKQDGADDAPAVTGLYSYRGTLRDSFIGQSGTSWAISFMDNMNAVTIADNVITGGTLGSGIDVGGSQNVALTGNDFEVCNGYGVRVAGSTDTGNGLCSAIRIESNYFERVSRPLSLGEAFIVRGATVCSNSIGNTTVTGITPPEYAVLLGRVEGAEISGTSAYCGGGDKEVFLRLVRVDAGGVGEHPVNCRIAGNFVTGVAADIEIVGEGLHAGHQSQIIAVNEMKFGTRPATGRTRVYISPMIHRATAGASRVWEQATPHGGQVDSIEILDATGSLDGVLRIGSASPTGAAEILNQDLSRLRLAGGNAVLKPDVSMMRPGVESTLSVLRMSGSGGFRVRIRYRN
jgi:hypothetical protein